jgi:hypothetical protein
MRWEVAVVAFFNSKKVPVSTLLPRLLRIADHSSTWQPTIASVSPVTRELTRYS